MNETTSERDKLEQLKWDIQRMLDANEAFLHWDNVKEQILITSNYTDVSVPID